MIRVGDILVCGAYSYVLVGQLGDVHFACLRFNGHSFDEVEMHENELYRMRVVGNLREIAKA